MPVNAGKCHFWEYCPCRYLPVNTGGKCHRPTLLKVHVHMSHNQKNILAESNVGMIKQIVDKSLRYIIFDNSSFRENKH